MLGGGWSASREQGNPQEVGTVIGEIGNDYICCDYSVITGLNNLTPLSSQV